MQYAALCAVNILIFLMCTANSCWFRWPFSMTNRAGSPWLDNTMHIVELIFGPQKKIFPTCSAIRSHSIANLFRILSRISWGAPVWILFRIRIWRKPVRCWVMRSDARWLHSWESLRGLISRLAGRTGVTNAHWLASYSQGKIPKKNVMEKLPSCWQQLWYVQALSGTCLAFDVPTCTRLGSTMTRSHQSDTGCCLDSESCTAALPKWPARGGINSCFVPKCRRSSKLFACRTGACNTILLSKQRET